MHLAFLLVASTTATIDYVAKHNLVRCLHCDTPIAVRSAELEADAARYAATCPKNHDSEYLSANNQGENLYWGGFSGDPPTEAASYEDAIEGWYHKEEKNYDYTTGGSKGGVIGHFTQVVWKGSVEIGCGMSTSCNNMWGGMQNSALVCRYRTAGNYAGQFLAQVGDKVSMGSQCTQQHSSCAAPGNAAPGNATSSGGGSSNGTGSSSSGTSGRGGGGSASGDEGTNSGGSDLLLICARAVRSCDLSRSGTAIFASLLIGGLLVFCVPLGLSLRAGAAAGAANGMGSESDRWLLLGQAVVSLVLVLSCANLRLFDDLSGSCMGATASAQSLVSLVASSLLLVLDALGRLHPSVGRTRFALCFTVWWVAGVIALTFDGPFTATSNAFFACWGAFFLAASKLVIALSRVAAERTAAVKAALRERQELVGLLLASCMMVGACVVIKVNGAPATFALVCSILTASIVTPMLFVATKLHSLAKAFIALMLCGLWIAVAYTATFGATAPFAGIGNGYFAAWLGAFFGCALLYHDGAPLLHCASNGLRGAGMGNGTAGSGKSNVTAASVEIKVDEDATTTSSAT